MLVTLSEQGPQGTEEEAYLGQRWEFSVVQFTVHKDKAVVLAPVDACAQWALLSPGKKEDISARIPPQCLTCLQQHCVRRDPGASELTVCSSRVWAHSSSLQSHTCSVHQLVCPCSPRPTLGFVILLPSCLLGTSVKGGLLTDFYRCLTENWEPLS